MEEGTPIIARTLQWLAIGAIAALVIIGFIWAVLKLL